MSFAGPAFLLAALLVVPAVWPYTRGERRARRGALFGGVRWRARLP